MERRVSEFYTTTTRDQGKKRKEENGYLYCSKMKGARPPDSESWGRPHSQRPTRFFFIAHPYWQYYRLDSVIHFFSHLTIITAARFYVFYIVN